SGRSNGELEKWSDEPEQNRPLTRASVMECGSPLPLWIESRESFPLRCSVLDGEYATFVLEPELSVWARELKLAGVVINLCYLHGNAINRSNTNCNATLWIS